MKKKAISVFTVLVISLLVTMMALAQSNLPGGGWWSGQQVQNVGNDAATIMITAYDKGSSATYDTQDTVAAGASKVFMPGDFSGMPDGFQGSAVVSSDQPIRAVVNVTNRLAAGDTLGITGGKAAAQYQGIDGTAVANTLYFPMAKAGHYDKTSTFYIQNAGDSAISPVATFKMRSGATHTVNLPSISPNQMAVFSLFDAATFDDNQAANSSGRVGGMSITAGGPMAGVVMEHYTSESPATILQGTRGFTSVDFDTKAYAPGIKHNRYGRFTGIQVQNVSGGTINVTVTYKGSAGACNGNTYTDSVTGLADGESHTFVQWEGKTNLIPNCAASATIVGTGNIVAIVTESYRFDSVPVSGQMMVMSSAIPDVAATAKLSAPTFKDDRYSKRTGLKIMNVGLAQATNIVATFNCTGGATFTAVSNPQTVAPGASVQFYTPSDDPGMFGANSFSSNNVTCGVVVTADQPIVALANESVIPGGTLEQDTNNYEGFNLTP